MSYDLEFLPKALKEWQRLDKSIQKQLKKKIAERLKCPHVPASRLRGFKSVYKIKLRASGYRLVYQVNDKKIVVLVVVVGKRERSKAYQEARKRLM